MPISLLKSIKSIFHAMTIRASRVFEDASSQALIEVGFSDDCERESCCWWDNLPEDLLREVLVKIEESESNWPDRKSVVACAGVCRSWRRIVKEIVQIPEVSGKLTFPISIKQPGPKNLMLQCFIRRNRPTQTYYLYLGLTDALIDDGKFLLAARKCKHTTSRDYIISLDADDMTKGSSTYIGKLRSNIWGTKFTIFDGQQPHFKTNITKSQSTQLENSKQVSPTVPTRNYPIAHISYGKNELGSRAPRRIQCSMDAIPSSVIEHSGAVPMETQFCDSNIDAFFKTKNIKNYESGPLDSKNDGVLELKNKAPRWHEMLEIWWLNFHGRVTVASVKNFQLVASPENEAAENETVLLQFGKVDKDLFTVDYRYPISAFQAFAICLSSFDTKISRDRHTS